ncbi:hypothetical protein [Burkholderia ubonensis]|uniref:hypothetical protein n=1 Tax=Burkholderia ubonensis TaxID=101571 RepID=UPI0018DF1D35|nr:hypothetical protein [Burkholderia ubonensis]
MHVALWLVSACGFMGLAGAFVANASAVEPGEYFYVEGGHAHGALLVKGSRFTLDTVGANCHTCSLTGTLKGNVGVASDGGETCRISITRVCLHTERACVATRTAAREARDAANTGRIAKERNAASGRSRGNPKLKNHSRGMPEIARMAASRVACLARPNGAPCSLPYARFRAFACAFRM